MLRVLLIEDNPGDARLLQELLADARERCPVSVAGDLASGLRLTGSQPFDVLVLDLNLPDSSGLETLTAAAAQAGRLPIVVLTGLDDAALGVQAIQMGAQDFLAKGRVTTEVLERVLRYAVERKKTAEALRESENKFRDLVEKSVAGVYIVQDNLFRYVNPKLAGIFGYAVEELTDRLGPEALTHAEDWPRVRQGMLRRDAGEVSFLQHSFRGVRKDGVVVHVEILGSRTVYRGRPAIIGTLIEVTETRRLEAQLRQAQKLEAVGQLAGGIAHDFNNLLNVVILSGNILQAKLPGGDPLRTQVGQIMGAAERAARLTHSLLAFSRRQIMNPQSLDLSELVRGFSHLLRRVIGEDIEIEVKADGDGPQVYADPGQIEQVLMNLATNARDAMPRGGTLRIAVSAEVLDEGVGGLPDGVKPGRYAALAVTDSGVGMDEATKGRIFEPFFTTKGEGKGTGLGLSMVWGIVRQHGGHIEVDSRPGEGTTFRVLLPATSPAAKAPRVVSAAALPRGSETILLAEDEASLREPVQTVLADFGYTVLAARDGEEALRVFHEHPEIELLILDITMPKKGGVEVYMEIAKLRPAVRVIFASGYSVDERWKNLPPEVRADFLPKPFQAGALLRKVREVLDRPALAPGAENRPRPG